MIIKHQDARKSIFKEHTKPNKNGINSISFENIEYNNTNTILFKVRRNGYEYIEVKYNDLKKINKNNHLYEVITKNTNRKLFFDLDFKDSITKTKFYVSYNEVNSLCLKFIEHLKTTYNISKDINFCIQASINDNFIYNQNDKIFNSFHIIFNVYTKTHTEQLQIIKQFKNYNYELNEYIDLCVYSNSKFIRALNQSKEQQSNETLRTDKLQVLNSTTYNIITDYFITAINKDRDIFLQIEIKETNQIEYNVIYKITQIKELKEYINDLKYNDLIHDKCKNNYNWSNNLNLIITILKLENIEWQNIINHEITQLFLEKSKITIYDTIEIYNSNVKYINDICKKKNLKKVINRKFFLGLKNEILQFIYKKLSKDKNIQLIFTKKIINNNLYINITENENIESTNNKLTLYDLNKYILLINANIYKNDISNSKIIKTKEQYNYYIDKILNLKNHSFNTNKCIEITNWNETTSQTNTSAYYESPVGSRKSSLRMNKDITEILKENTTNIILMPCDTRSLCNSQLGKMTHLFNELNIDLSLLKIYLTTKPDKVKINNTRLFICCYDSIYNYRHIKFTHIIIDEYLNVRKRFMSITGNNSIKEEHLRNFFNIIKNSKTIKCYDADLQKYDLDLLSKFSNKEIIYYKLKDFIQVNNTIIFTNYKRQKEDIIYSLLNNKNFSISSNSKKEAEILFDWIIHLKTDVKIALITKDGAKDNKCNQYNENLKIELTTHTKKWEQYNCIIYTPTIMTGISQDSNKYFYKHYGFMCCDSTDHTQTAQMLFRVRNTETNIIMICDIKNRIGCFYEYEEDVNLILKRNFYEDYFIKNNQSIINNDDNANDDEDICFEDISEDIPDNEDLIINYPKTFIEEYAKIIEIEETEKRQFYYNLFYTLKKWGCNVLKCEFYDLIDDTKQIINRSDINYNHTNLNSINNFQEFRYLDFINNINESKNNQENDKHINKTLSIMKYGIDSTIYNHLKNDEFYKYFIFYELLNSNEYTTYKRLSKLTYFSIRNVIYKMVEYVLIGIKDLEALFLKQTKINNTEMFLNWLLCSFILFIIFDDNEIEYNKFLTNILNCDAYAINITKEKIITSLEPIKHIIDLFIKKKIIINNNIETLLNQVSKYFYLEKIIISNNDYIFSRTGIPYRIETNNYILDKKYNESIINEDEENNEFGDCDDNDNNDDNNDNEDNREEDNFKLIDYKIKDTIKNISKNDYDDIVNYININDKCITLFNKQLNYSFTPKIRLFDSYKDSKTNKKFIESFDIYYNNNNKQKLILLLNKELSEINNKALKIKYNDIYNNVEKYIKSISNNITNDNYSNENVIFSEGEILKQSKIINIHVSNFGNVYYINNEDNIKCKVKEYTFIIPIKHNRLKKNFNYTYHESKNNIKEEIQNIIKYKYIYVNEDIIFIDRLVCECFLLDYREDYFIKHKDNNYANNNIDNLEIVEKWIKDHYKDILTTIKNTIKEEKIKKNKEKRTEKRNDKILCNICDKMYSYTHKKRHYETHKLVSLNTKTLINKIINS
jgi:hypothetical protein